MSSETVYMICGKKLVLPATPEKIDFKWEDLAGHTHEQGKSKGGSRSKQVDTKVPKPVRKRLHRKKISKT